MALDPTQRFSTRVEAYARYRPAYPAGTLALLERECWLTPASCIADVGSGTGLLAQLFLDFGCEVFGVEPNPEMRAAGASRLGDNPRFESVNGRAEATTLADGSVDLVTAGQAFHWFDAAGARAEFRRILKPAGWVALIWNERRVMPGFMAEHEAVLNEFARERTHPAEAEFDAFFGSPDWRMQRIPHYQKLDEEGLRGRLESSSWSPLPGAQGYHEMMLEIAKLFEKYQVEGQVTIDYDTEIWWGRL